jgi:predicted ATPase
MSTFTPVIADDGDDLASALQTLREIGPDDELDDAIDQAFPGSRLEIEDSGGLFRLRLRQTGLLRAWDAAELSDGTLRFLLWAAALLTPARAAGRHDGPRRGPDAGRRRHPLGAAARAAGRRRRPRRPP